MYIGPPEIELQEVVSYWTWVLGAELGSPGRAVCTLTMEPPSVYILETDKKKITLSSNGIKDLLRL